MSKITQLQLREMEERLSDIVIGKDTLREYERAVVTIQRFLAQIAEALPNFGDNRFDEINFYKELMPRFHGHLIYYIRLYQLESSFPNGNERAKKRMLKSELKFIEDYFKMYPKEYRYYKSEDEIFDGDLFVRQQTPSMLFLDETVGLSDHQLCTPTGIVFAKFFAYERLQEYINDALNRLQKQPKGNIQKLKLKAKKMAIAEVVYGLAYSDVFIDAEIKEIAGIFEAAIDVDLSHIYRMKYDLYARQNPSSFLDYMSKRLREGFSDDEAGSARR